MTSLATFPHLRRTLTDVMEDELYHIPPHISGQLPQNSQPSQIMSNLLWNNSNQSVKQSPQHTHQKIFRNTSALNSEELLTIPDDYTYQSSQPTDLTRMPSHDMYFDVPDEGCNVFNEYADPDITTTNQNVEYHFPPMEFESSQPQKLLKFNEDLTLEYFNNDDESQFVVMPGSLSPNMIPEDIEDEEISDDDDDEFDMTYLDDATISEVAQNQINEQVPQLLPSHYHTDDTGSGPSQQQFLAPQSRPNLSRDSTELESDIDRMSLASDDEDDFSSVMDDDEQPSFKTDKAKKRAMSISQQPQKQQQLYAPQQVHISQFPPTFQSLTHGSPAELSHHNIEQATIVTEDGMHKCNLLSSSGQPCLKQFSRPYDLVRHQETIHASKKKIFRCIVCNQQEGGLSKKTFSRGDALSRHVRVKHGLTGDQVVEAIQYAKDNVEFA